MFCLMHLNLINHHGLDFLMAALFKLDNDKEEFSGFDIQHQSQRSVVESNPT